MTRAQLGQAYYKRLKVLVRIVCVTGERFFKIGFDIKNAGRTFCLELDFVFIPFIFLAQMLTFLCDSGSYATPQGNGRLIGVFSTLNLVRIPRIQAPGFPAGTSQQHRSSSYRLFKYNFNLDKVRYNLIRDKFSYSNVLKWFNLASYDRHRTLDIRHSFCLCECHLIFFPPHKTNKRNMWMQYAVAETYPSKIWLDPVFVRAKIEEGFKTFYNLKAWVWSKTTLLLLYLGKWTN